jgi:AcrR family transcriptional regulator
MLTSWSLIGIPFAKSLRVERAEGRNMRQRSKLDRRVQYTKMFLRESLLELMKEKPIGKITPTELCRRADVNRNTFYAHYDSPEALLKSIEDELYEEIQRSLDLSRMDGSILTMVTDICHAIRKNGDLCKVLFSERGDKQFLRRIMNIARAQSTAEWKSAGMAGDPSRMDMVYQFIASGSVSVIEAWVQEGMKSPPEEIAGFIEKVSGGGLRAFMAPAAE